MKAKNFIFAKRNKYNAQTQTVDGINFHSKLEAGYYCQLKIEMRGGLIRSFERQVSFPLYAAKTVVENSYCEDMQRVCDHIVDFVVTLPDGSREIREVKGFATAVWDLKRKIFESNYPDLPYRVIR